MEQDRNPKEILRREIIRALKTVNDPEMSTNIYDLGLIYEIEINDMGRVDILMTLTSPACPASQELVLETQRVVEDVGGVGEVSVALTFDPPWDWSKLSEEAKLELNLF